MFTNMDKRKKYAFASTIVVTCYSFDMFNANKLEEGASEIMGPSVGVWVIFLLCEQW
jgi:hypothetical protein